MRRGKRPSSRGLSEASYTGRSSITASVGAVIMAAHSFKWNSIHALRRRRYRTIRECFSIDRWGRPDDSTHFQASWPKHRQCRGVAMEHASISGVDFAVAQRPHSKDPCPRSRTQRWRDRVPECQFRRRNQESDRFLMMVEIFRARSFAPTSW